MAEGEVYSTHQMKVIVTLKAMGHAPVKVVKDAGGKLVFSYPKSAEQDAEKFLLNPSSVMISASALWSAYDDFKLTMRQAGL